MNARQVVAGACIGFVAMTLVAVSTRGWVMPLFKPHSNAEAMLYVSVFQAVSALFAAGLAWTVALIVKRAVVARVAAFVLCGYVLGFAVIFVNDRLANKMSGKLGEIPAHLVLPLLLLAVISLIVIARGKPAKSARRA